MGKIWTCAAAAHQNESVAEIKQTRSLTALALHPGGLRMATGNALGFAKIWDVSTASLHENQNYLATPLITLDSDTSLTEATSCDWSPDGTRLVAGYASGNVRVFTAESLPRYSPEIYEGRLLQHIADGHATKKDVRTLFELQAEAGDWDKAEAMIRSQRKLADTSFLASRWFVAGPFSRTETNGNKALAASPSANWRSTPNRLGDGLDMNEVSGIQHMQSALGKLRIYSMKEQAVVLSTKRWRIGSCWLNDQLVAQRDNRYVTRDDRPVRRPLIPIVLKRGWITSHSPFPSFAWRNRCNRCSEVVLEIRIGRDHLMQKARHTCKDQSSPERSRGPSG